MVGAPLYWSPLARMTSVDDAGRETVVEAVPLDDISSALPPEAVESEYLLLPEVVVSDSPSMMTSPLAVVVVAVASGLVAADLTAAAGAAAAAAGPGAAVAVTGSAFAAALIVMSAGAALADAGLADEPVWPAENAASLAVVRAVGTAESATEVCVGSGVMSCVLMANGAEDADSTAAGVTVDRLFQDVTVVTETDGALGDGAAGALEMLAKATGALLAAAEDIGAMAGFDTTDN